MEGTESCRLMRGAPEPYFEYIPELHTEFVFDNLDFIREHSWTIVGCDGLAHVNRAGVLSDTHAGRQCELLMN